MNGHQMTGYKCNCGIIYYPQVARCAECKGSKFEPVPLGDEAKVITYTHLTSVPTGLDYYLITLGIVEFPNGARATGQLVGEKASAVHIGSRVKPSWGKLREIGGFDQFGWRFEVLD